ncbi:class I SAM-dependent methyltransferase [Halorientalis sp. IM1011]|uniref:class I SAM-dependent methyltransferase n=1 Tax=Halorientalis sp. IM1011 TaxID=1932360 RepID=UPI0020A2E6CE
MDENDHGTLYSIDYPYYADVPLSEFRDETFEDFGGAAIPSDKEPGWIVPDEYQSQWDLRIGKSQRELPQLVTELESIDVFIHDSEHSLPCMLFEYDLAWEWFGSNGIILSDDIDWNGAFDSFASARTAESGQITSSVGYLIKGGVK